MSLIRRSFLVLALGCPGVVQGYSGVADVTLSWGVGGSALNWSSTTQNALAVVSNDSRFTTLAGSNVTTWFNPDFAASSNYGSGTGDDCLSLLPGYEQLELRKYGCRQTDTNGSNLPVFHRSPPSDAGPAAAAVGTLNFTDTTLTGTLTVVATTDESTGGDESSIGNGTSGFNVRALDTSAFGNVWYGASAGATLTVDLTGDFSAAGWEITGGTVRFSDPGFQCQQGGIGGVAPAYVLCQISAVPGGLSADGSNLSFGLDADGGGVGTAMTEVSVRDMSGNVVASLAGVLASLAVGPGGALSTDFGEYRSGAGTSSGGCLGQIRWDGIQVICGTLTAGALQITGTATPVDTEPDPFNFPSAGDVPLGTLVTSDPATITGIAAPARITVAGGLYSIDCSATYTAAPGNIPGGSTVCVRHTSSASPATDTVTTLTVGGVPVTFTSTTVPADTTPESFVFADQVDVTAAALIVSAPVTITGINGVSPVSVVGGEYSVGCNGTYGAAPGSVDSGQTVCVRHMSSAVPLTPTDTTLIVGGISDVFTSTTAAAPPDTTPEPFAFADRADVQLAVTVTSAPVTISGIDSPAAVSVTGGAYSVGCAVTYVTTPGMVSNGESVCVRHTSSAANATAVSTTLTVDTVSAAFSSTTVDAIMPDTTPESFTFVDRNDVARTVPVISAPVTITGLTAVAPVLVTGGDYSIGCTGPFVLTPGTVANDQTICVRHTSAAAYSAQTSTTLTVGGISDVFTSTTVAAVPSDTTPDAFAFAGRAGVALSTAVTSAAVTITGIDAPAAVTVTGGEYSIGCAAGFTTAAGMITAGQTVCVRHTSSALNGTATSTTLTVGGVSDSFTSTTVVADGGGDSGGGGGGGAVDWWLLGLLAGLPACQRRRQPVFPG